jgi:hypothetical protein
VAGLEPWGKPFVAAAGLLPGAWSFYIFVQICFDSIRHAREALTPPESVYIEFY